MVGVSVDIALPRNGRGQNAIPVKNAGGDGGDDSPGGIGGTGGGGGPEGEPSTSLSQCRPKTPNTPTTMYVNIRRLADRKDATLYGFGEFAQRKGLWIRTPPKFLAVLQIFRHHEKKRGRSSF